MRNVDDMADKIREKKELLERLESYSRRYRVPVEEMLRAMRHYRLSETEVSRLAMLASKYKKNFWGLVKLRIKTQISAFELYQIAEASRRLEMSFYEFLSYMIEANATKEDIINLKETSLIHNISFIRLYRLMRKTGKTGLEIRSIISRAIDKNKVFQKYGLL